MRDYKLEIGNSSTGQIGLVAYNRARRKANALGAFRREIGDQIEIKLGRYYQRVFLNWKAITTKDIEEA